jgi:hypothetical protein
MEADIDHRMSRRRWIGALGAALLLPGCALVPDVTHKPRFHNPFPQLYKVAVLPFYNQSREPTLDGDSVAIAYYTELQAIPGFEIMPVGVSRKYLEAMGREPQFKSWRGRWVSTPSSSAQSPSTPLTIRRGSR